MNKHKIISHLSALTSIIEMEDGLYEEMGEDSGSDKMQLVDQRFVHV